MNPAAFEKPRRVSESDGLDHQRVPFPVGGSVAHVGLGSHIVLVVRTAVGPHPPGGVDGAVASCVPTAADAIHEKVAWAAFRLEDLVRGAAPGNADGLAELYEAGHVSW